MIATAAVFLVAAIVTLVIGWFQEGLAMVYVSIGASVVALAFLVAGMVRRRAVAPATAGAPYGPAEGTEAAATAPAEPRERTKPSAPLPQRRPAARPPTGRPDEEKPAAEAAPSRLVAKKPAAKKAAAKKPVAKKPVAKKATPSRPSPRSLVMAIPERGTFHRSDCRFVKGRRDTERITLGTAEKRGYSSCGVCKPTEG